TTALFTQSLSVSAHLARDSQAAVCQRRPEPPSRRRRMEPVAGSGQKTLVDRLPQGRIPMKVEDAAGEPGRVGRDEPAVEVAERQAQALGGAAPHHDRYPGAEGGKDGSAGEGRDGKVDPGRMGCTVADGEVEQCHPAHGCDAVPDPRPLAEL